MTGFNAEQNQKAFMAMANKESALAYAHTLALQENDAVDEAVNWVVSNFPPRTQDSFFSHAYAVRAVLVDIAHGEALEIEEQMAWDKITPEQRTTHDNRVMLGQLLKSKHNTDCAFDACHAEAIEINDAIEHAGLVIRSMRGCDIEGILSGIRHGMYEKGFGDLMSLSQTSLRVEVARAHSEALEIDAARQGEKS